MRPSHSIRAPRAAARSGDRLLGSAALLDPADGRFAVCSLQSGVRLLEASGLLENTAITALPTRDAVLRLADFCRLTLHRHGEAEEPALGEELEMLRAYLDIEQIRLSELLEYSIKCDPRSPVSGCCRSSSCRSLGTP